MNGKQSTSIFHDIQDDLDLTSWMEKSNSANILLIFDVYLKWAGKCEVIHHSLDQFMKDHENSKEQIAFLTLDGPKFSTSFSSMIMSCSDDCLLQIRTNYSTALEPVHASQIVAGTFSELENERGWIDDNPINSNTTTNTANNNKTCTIYKTNQPTNHYIHSGNTNELVKTNRGLNNGTQQQAETTGEAADHEGDYTNDSISNHDGQSSKQETIVGLNTLLLADNKEHGKNMTEKVAAWNSSHIHDDAKQNATTKDMIDHLIAKKGKGCIPLFVVVQGQHIDSIIEGVIYPALEKIIEEHISSSAATSA
jgi:hypothetical protein